MNMDIGTFKILPTMATTFLISLVFIPSLSQANREGAQGIADTKGEIELKTYIVFVAKRDKEVSEQSEDGESYYQSFLPNSISDTNGQGRMVHMYRNVASGFAARLTAEEAKAMEEKDGFLQARPQKILPLHTTHSPSFLGLQQGSEYPGFPSFWNYSNYGKGMIIGVLDTGVSPDHPSFSDKGMPSPPAKWKGNCEFKRALCNKKLIGARNFVSDPNEDKGRAPFDEEGHGTHTASTAAGNFVPGANVFDNSKGTAVGMAPMAHLAIYKVCESSGCAESDILAAMDAAIEDGVDVLSLSIGGPSVPFYDDPIALGAFAATQKGIFVSCSAGNSGPELQSTSNEAPWVLTAGASTMDRSIRTRVRLGNGQSFLGESVFQPKINIQVFLPLVAAGNHGSQSAAFCGPDSFKGVDVKGKIVLCQRGGRIRRVDKGIEVKNAGGAGMILMNEKLDGYSTLADVHVLAASHISYSDGRTIQTYINSTLSPTAMITFEGTVLGLLDAPAMISFSSRGPSLASPGVLKPDIIGPGASILAAWPISVENKTNTKSTFNIISGTSMSCPHLSGIAALLKASHPNWSPAAIKSAIMTTAYTVSRRGIPIRDETHRPADILATGAGHVNPRRAVNPGLVYDIKPADYIPYLCGLGYRDREISYIVQQKVKCSQESSIPEAQLNYPSFSIIFGKQTQTYTRTVTNVGPASSTYTVEIQPPLGTSISVSPGQLVFNRLKHTETYTVTFSRTGGSIGANFSQGYILWTSNNHYVRSPILVTFSKH